MPQKKATEWKQELSDAICKFESAASELKDLMIQFESLDFEGQDSAEVEGFMLIKLAKMNDSINKILGE